MEKTDGYVPRSDGRLVTLLRGGDEILSSIDPEGVFSRGVVRKIVMGSVGEDGRYSVRLFLNFPTGDCICLSCLRTDEGMLVRSLSVGGQGRKWENAEINPGKTVLSSFGDISGISVRIRRNLASVSPAGAKDGGFDSGASLKAVDTFRKYLVDALFWQVEGAAEDSKARNCFGEYSVKFSRDSDGVCVKDSVEAVAELKEGRITVSMEVDVFGLSEKKVRLIRNLGLGHSFEADCFSTRDGNRFPSLRVALDLNRLVPVYYTTQRGKKITMGSPKGYRT